MPRRRPWPEVLGEVTATRASASRAVSPCLLAELAYHADQIPLLSASDQAKLLAALPALVAAAGWGSAVEHVAPIASPLAARPMDLAKLHAAVVRSAPADANGM